MSEKKTPGLILETAVSILERIDREDSTLDDCVDSLRAKNPGICPAVADLLFNYFRNKAGTDWLVTRRAKYVKPKVMRLLAAAAAQILFQRGIGRGTAASVAVDTAKKLFSKETGGFVNAALRGLPAPEGFAEALKDAPENVRLGLPDFVFQRWTRFYGPEKTAETAAALKKQPPLTFRLLRGAAIPESFADFTVKIDSGVPDCPWDFYECREPKKLFSSEFFKSGAVYVQDPSTAAPVTLAPPPASAKTIMDLCAAPGGKTILLHELKSPEARIFAADRSLRRLRTASANFKKAGFDIPVAGASAYEPPFRDGSFDYILADVPCSNTGSAGKRPDALWRLSEKSLRDAVRFQAKILESAAGLAAPGGSLVYSTCSLEPEENGLLIDNFLKDHPEFSLVKNLTLLPSSQRGGGHCALLRRAAADTN
jgi:16S rRNA (cytosine967-C5)-methyltransferase